MNLSWTWNLKLMERLISSSFYFCRLCASLPWASSSWSWVCHLSSPTGWLESPEVEVDISLRDWPKRAPTECQPKLSLSLNYPDLMCTQPKPKRKVWLNQNEGNVRSLCLQRKKGHSDTWQGTKCPQSWREHRRNAVCSDQITTNVKPWWGCSEACAEMWKTAKKMNGNSMTQTEIPF